jgi:hypothetical protein
MFTSHGSDALVLAHERGRQLRQETAAVRRRPAAAKRRLVAASLRRAANLLDPQPLAPRPA